MGMTLAPGAADDGDSSSTELSDVMIDPRILLIDDNQAIHEDIRKILERGSAPDAGLNDMAADLFDEAPVPESSVRFRIDSAYQGQEGLELLKAARAQGRPYAVAFVDVRMPPGWDGIETIGHLWREDPDLQIVICTAFSDHSWPEIIAKLAPADGLLILRKPFDSIEIRQMVHALSAKWMLSRELAGRMADLEQAVQVRTRDLVTANDQLRREILTRARLETELQLAQRLETVGQLASTLAHDANGPMLDVGDSVRILRLAFEDLTNLVGTYRRMLLGVCTLPGQAGLVEQMREADEGVDLQALEREIPRAFERLVEGTHPMSQLVNAVTEMVREETGEHLTTAAAELDAHAAPTLRTR
jgi:two-component system NtrC family sensor kinase